VNYVSYFFVGATFLVACARPADTGGARTPDAPLGTNGVEAGAPGIPWSKKNHEQRMEFMGLVVYPKMKAVFREHDPKEFAQFRCQTCHGEDMESVDFKMPNSLFALPASDPVKAGSADDANMTTFMVDKVVPSMNALFEKDDAGTAATLGCLNCHQREPE
jgi:hypothetical protein